MYVIARAVIGLARNLGLSVTAEELKRGNNWIFQENATVRECRDFTSLPPWE